MIVSKKHIVHLVLLGIIFFSPFIQRSLHVFQFSELKGWKAGNTKPRINSKNWFSGEYQKEFDHFSSDSFGFTEPLVRTINQIDYTLFNSANAQYVVVGKNNYLYESEYIDAVTGANYIGEKTIREKSEKLRDVYQILKQKGTTLLLVMAPGKGSYFPEYIPSYYQRYYSDSTNYTSFISEWRRLSLPHLDFHAWFRSMKDSSPIGLFPQTGIHWSTYGMILAGDSITKYLEEKSAKDLVDYEFKLEVISNQMKKSDADIEDGMNLWTDLNHLPMAYPKLHFNREGKETLKTAVIADSYFWGLYDHGFSTQVFDSGEFWYYFNDIYPKHFEAGLTIDEIDLKSAIERQEVIILLGTDATLPKFGWGFIEKAWDLYCADNH